MYHFSLSGNYQQLNSLTVKKLFLDHLKQRYYNYYNAGLLTEGTVLLSIVAPLLERLGFHEPPFLFNLKFPLALK